VVVRLPGSQPPTLSTYPEDGAALEGQLIGSPVMFTFQTVDCADVDQVPSVDGSFCVCAPGYTSVDPVEAGSGFTTCEPCPQGFFKDSIETNDCQPCDVSQSTLGTGSAHASDCVCKAGCAHLSAVTNGIACM